MEWINAKVRGPNREELDQSEKWDFLCRVLVPVSGGTAQGDTRIIHYDPLEECWTCNGIIVTHWMSLPALPVKQ